MASEDNVGSSPKNIEGLQDNVASEINTAVNSPSESVNTAPEDVVVIYFVWALMNVSLDLCAWIMHNLCSDL
ncbi:hypothetical protein A2U01_0081265 [Trifolium medium]|uniref:Uncharacterized protein n=1 Tax=Trifolium medium TaxID=97028 RepID=A0A392TIG8_9FABA|nr:hypothetical protein [Trifolium medium]